MQPHLVTFNTFRKTFRIPLKSIGSFFGYFSIKFISDLYNCVFVVLIGMMHGPGYGGMYGSYYPPAPYLIPSTTPATEAAQQQTKHEKEPGEPGKEVGRDADGQEAGQVGSTLAPAELRHQQLLYQQYYGYPPGYVQQLMSHPDYRGRIPGLYKQTNYSRAVFE